MQDVLPIYFNQGLTLLTTSTVLLKLTEMDKHCDNVILLQLTADSPERDANVIPRLAKLQTQSKHFLLTLNPFPQNNNQKSRIKHR